MCDGDWCNVLKKKNGQLVGGGIDIGVVVCEQWYGRIPVNTQVVGDV